MSAFKLVERSRRLLEMKLQLYSTKSTLWNNNNNILQWFLSKKKYKKEKKYNRDAFHLMIKSNLQEPFAFDRCVAGL